MHDTGELFALLLDSTVKRMRPFAFAAQYLATGGIGQIAGSLAGAA